MDLQAAMSTLRTKIERLQQTLLTLELEFVPNPTQLLAEEKKAVLSLPAIIPEISYQQPPTREKSSKRKIGGRPNKELILEYIQNHPECKREEVAKALGINSTAASFHMGELKKSGLLTSVRKNGQWLWNAKVGKTEQKPEVFDDERPDPIVNHKDGLDKPGSHLCVICDKSFSYKGGLTEHIRSKHMGGK